MMTLIDFGMLVFTWVIQLIVYPSFKYYNKSNLDDWHPIYTQRVSLIVIPLMVGQLVFHLIGTFDTPSLYKVISLLLIVLAWVLTFVFAVPLHGQLSSSNNPDKTINQLIKVHWGRTVSWSLVFLIDCSSLLLNTNNGYNTI